ncbi:NTP transferase domain-containing protein [soil metagenome]
MHHAKTVIINCAGVGARLGYGHTKALLEFAGKPIIIHHLEQLKDIADVRVVVGHGATDVIDTVLAYRRDVTFVFNHDYLKTNTLDSLALGAKNTDGLIVSLDGDLLIKPQDLATFIQQDEELIGIIQTYTDQPVYAIIEKKDNDMYLTAFGQQQTKYEWTGLVQIHSDKLIQTTGHVYQALEQHLPLKAIEINCREIDTPQDLEKAMQWSRDIF